MTKATKTTYVLGSLIRVLFGMVHWEPEKNYRRKAVNLAAKDDKDMVEKDAHHAAWSLTTEGWSAFHHVPCWVLSVEEQRAAVEYRRGILDGLPEGKELTALRTQWVAKDGSIVIPTLGACWAFCRELTVRKYVLQHVVDPAVFDVAVSIRKRPSEMELLKLQLEENETATLGRRKTTIIDQIYALRKLVDNGVVGKPIDLKPYFGQNRQKLWAIRCAAKAFGDSIFDRVCGQKKAVESAGALPQKLFYGDMRSETMKLITKKNAKGFEKRASEALADTGRTTVKTLAQAQWEDIKSSAHATSVIALVADAAIAGDMSSVRAAFPWLFVAQTELTVNVKAPKAKAPKAKAPKAKAPKAKAPKVTNK
jgi:hypothetical protein